MHFCDDEASSRHKHNREAPTKQNSVCNSQSIWSVISDNVDFARNNNLPNTIANLKPKFNVVRVFNGARYVLVTDVSGSMVDYVRTTDTQFLRIFIIVKLKTISLYFLRFRIVSADCTTQPVVGFSTTFPTERLWASSSSSNK